MFKDDPFTGCTRSFNILPPSSRAHTHFETKFYKQMSLQIHTRFVKAKIQLTRYTHATAQNIDRVDWRKTAIFNYRHLENDLDKYSLGYYSEGL